MTSDELSARERIRDTLARYNHAGDRGGPADLAACFAPDGVLEISSEDRSTGPDKIETRLSRVVADSSQRAARPLLRDHASSIETRMESPEEARAPSYLPAFAEIGLDHWGRYDDRLRRCGDRWLFAHGRVRVDGTPSESRTVVDAAGKPA